MWNWMTQLSIPLAAPSEDAVTMTHPVNLYPYGPVCLQYQSITDPFWVATLKPVGSFRQRKSFKNFLSFYGRCSEYYCMHPMYEPFWSFNPSTSGPKDTSILSKFQGQCLEDRCTHPVYDPFTNDNLMFASGGPSIVDTCSLHENVLLVCVALGADSSMLVILSGLLMLLDSVRGARNASKGTALLRPHTVNLL